MNGFERRSASTLVTGPWPGNTRVSGGSAMMRRRDLPISSVLPNGRSVRPIDPAKRQSPTSAIPWPWTVTWPGECPGVCITANDNPPSRRP